MRLEDYFEFLDPDDIRIKGHRIGIDDVIKYYLQGDSPEQILEELPSLNLEKIYATITYYLHNRTEMDAYMLRLARWREQHYQEWLANPSPLALRLRALKSSTRAGVTRSFVKIRFLLDENLSPKLKTTVLRFDPAIDILRVGDSNAPPLGTLDPDILHYLELSQRLLVTDNRKSIPEHLEEHWADGGHVWGLVWLRPSGTIGSWAETLFLIWETTKAKEWFDQLDWIPF